ncbi:MAG TPA: hypothetical protein VEB23_05605 [Ramlibacter sp.]|nr:hypothetical protein [Ramlibacter sp.]
MIHAVRIVMLLSLAGCAGVPRQAVDTAASACLNAEASYACQVERYHNVSQ